MSNEKEDILMQQEEKYGFVPKLRFPEFRDADAWKCVPLNKQAKRCIQKNRDGVITRVLTNSAEYGVVDQRDYFDKDIATQGNLNNYYVVKKGDYVYNPRISAAAPVGPISKNNVATGVMSPLYSVFRFGDSNNDFYAYYFKTAGWHQYMRRASSTGARHDRMAITNDDFMAMPLPASTPEEQQKIAECLSSLDDLIRLETEKLDAIKVQKKSLMHQLFPAEGETLPKLRFPEFRSAGESKVKALAEIVQLFSGGTPSKAEPTYWNGNIPWISASSMHEVIIGDADLRVTNEAIGNGTRLAKKGCILILVRGSMLFKRVPICIAERDVAFNQDVKALTVAPDVVSMFLLYQLIALSPRIPINETGIGAGKIETEVLESLEIWVPEISEQQKIVDCIASMDEVIATQYQKVGSLKIHKNGLMQQLFPALDEVHQ